jgi:hypothetical protein
VIELYLGWDWLKSETSRLVRELFDELLEGLAHDDSGIGSVQRRP